MININLTGMWHAAKAAIPHLKTAIRFAPQVVRRPRWLLSYAQTAHLPDLTVPNMTGQGQAPPTFFGAYRQGMASPLPTWDDVWWLAEQWGGPFMVKGSPGSTTPDRRPTPG
jgi:isopentenyl diphosphate isomerase/L-lactate dehydrogenase-like FMN-dependent dehydrogenase